MKYLPIRTLASCTIEQFRCYNLLYTSGPFHWHSQNKLIEALRDSGYGLKIMSLFSSLQLIDVRGHIEECPIPESKTRYDSSFKTLREIISSGIQYEIIGNHEELDFIKKCNPLLYDRIESHIVWKGIKKTSN